LKVVYTCLYCHQHGSGDPLFREQPLLAKLYAASVQGRVSTGPKEGHYLMVGVFSLNGFKTKERLAHDALWFRA
jgi:hypothetical protein